MANACPFVGPSLGYSMIQQMVIVLNTATLGNFREISVFVYVYLTNFAKIRTLERCENLYSKEIIQRE